MMQGCFFIGNHKVEERYNNCYNNRNKCGHKSRRDFIKKEAEM